MIKFLLLGVFIMCEMKSSIAQKTSQLDELKKHTKWQSGMTPAQQMIASTGEDLLSGGIVSPAQTVFSGYGDVSITQDFAYNNRTGKLDRVVLFVGHQFNKGIAFFSELEVANARVEGGELLGEVGMEQAFIKMSINPRKYFNVGLIIPRIGIANEFHLPINFNGTSIPFVEKLIIPTTWSDLGISYNGQMSTMPMQYSLSILNGLNAQRFEHGFGYGKGVSSGKSVSFNNLAVTGSLRAYINDFQIQLSGYYGGSVPYNPYVADSLGIRSGIFANPIMLAESNVQYNNGALNAKALVVYTIHQAAKTTNRVFANNTPEVMYGLYGEVGYDLMYYTTKEKWKNKSLIAFARYEILDLNAKIPSNGIYDGTLKQAHAIIGLSYFPTTNVVIKSDFRYTHTGAFNPYTVVNPPPLLRPYPEDNCYLSMGFGYSF